MAVRILDVNLITDYQWGDIKGFESWGVVRNTNTSWLSIKQTAEVSQSINIEVEITGGSWGAVNELLPSWNFIKDEFTNWESFKNW